jgi:hypothetical protein
MYALRHPNPDLDLDLDLDLDIVIVIVDTAPLFHTTRINGRPLIVRLQEHAAFQ